MRQLKNSRIQARVSSYSIVAQFGQKVIVQDLIKCFAKVQQDAVHLLSIVNRLSKIFDSKKMLTFTRAFLSKAMFITKNVVLIKVFH